MDSQYTDFLLKKELQEVLDNTENGFKNYKTDVKIKAGDLWLIPIRLDHMSLIRGYGDGSLGDFRVIECMMLLGDVTHKLLPSRDDLIVELTHTPMDLTATAIDLTSRITVKTYRGLVNTKYLIDPSVDNKSSVDPNIANLNHGTMIPVQIQLIDESVYKLLMISCGMTYREVTTIDAMVNTYVRYLKLLGNKEHERVDRISIRKGHNPTVRKQINIPDGTMVKDIHHLLQNNEGGIYNTGISRYIQDNTFYVYPLYDFKAYEKNLKVLNIINVAEGKFMGSEVTFKDEETKLTILASGKASTQDEGLVNKLETGNAIRFGDADKLLSNSFDKENKSLVDRATNQFEVGISKLKTAFNNVRTSNTLSSNPYRHYTDLARKQGKQIDINWVKGSADLLYPGMPVKYITSSGAKIETSYGTLLGVSENRIPTTPGVTTNQFNSIVTLNIFVNREPEVS